MSFICVIARLFWFKGVGVCCVILKAGCDTIARVYASINYRARKRTIHVKCDDDECKFQHITTYYIPQNHVHNSLMITYEMQ